MTKRPEAKIQKIIQNALNSQLNLWAYHVPDEKLRYQKVERGVRPDIIGISPDKGSPLIEVKVMIKHKTIPQNFRLDSISNGQRNMLDYRSMAHNTGVFTQHAYIAIGTNFIPATQSWDGCRHQTKVWLIPWAAWVAFEYLACSNPAGWINEVQIEDHFSDTLYELIRGDNAEYLIDKNHPIMLLKATKPFIRYKDRDKWLLSYRSEK